MKQLPTEGVLLEAAALLKAGRPVALPTETVYGLAASAFSEPGILAIFEAKQRPLTDPLIMHVSSSMGSLEALSDLGLIDASLISFEVKKNLKKLMAAFWPGPLTFLLPKGPKVSPLITSSKPFVAVRMPSHQVFLDVIDRVGAPLVAPSANLFGRTSPTCADHVVSQLYGRIPLVIDGGSCSVGVESTIVSFQAENQLLILRPGGVSKEDLARASGLAVESYARPASLIEEASLAPGMLDSHYAPKKKLFVLQDKDFLQKESSFYLQASKASSIGAISLSASSLWLERLQAVFPHACLEHQSLSSSADPCGQDAAKNLFAAFHYLDQSDCELILMEAPIASDHLWSAIWDRIKRASK